MEKIFEIDGRKFVFSAEEEVQIAFNLERSEGGISYYKIAFDWGKRVIPKKITLEYKFTCVDVYTVWDPLLVDRNVRFNKLTSPSRLAWGMPVKQVQSKNGTNVHTVALSDVRTPMTLGVGSYPRPNFDKIQVEIVFFTQICGPFDKYETVLRIDERKQDFDDVLRNTRAWYDEFGYKSAYSPEYSRVPTYSSWYSLWQSMTAKQLLKECKEAVKYGMKTVIVDDGWQTDDATVIYGYVGDWKPVYRKFGDMKSVVDKVHALGMKFMLWYSVPFVGYFSKNYKRFEGKYLDVPPGRNKGKSNCDSLDPRYKEVRDFIVQTYVNAVKDWGLDGLKLDFINNFESNGKVTDEMDFVTVEEATEQLLRDVYDALTAINPEILLEFRQPYFGPVVNAYGNMIRVWDCPLGSSRNLTGTLDLRLLSGGCSVHSDMIIWAKEDSLQSVASQLWGVVFSVPQISLRFDDVTREQKAALKFFLDFWTAHRETLLNPDIKLTPVANSYGYVSSTLNGEQITLCNVSARLDVDGRSNVYYMINNSGVDGAILKAEKGRFAYEILDCTGKRIKRKTTVKSALSEVDVPFGGMLVVYAL